MGEALFVHERRAALRNLPGSSDFSRSRKELNRELVVGSASDPLSERHGWTTEEVLSHWNWAPGSSFLNNEFSLTWRLAWNALPLFGLDFRAGLTDMPDCARCGSGLEETAKHVFYYCERFRPFWDHVGEWTARIEPKQHLVLYFRHQLRVKIRYDRKCLDCVTFDKWWVNAAGLVVRKGAMLEPPFPPLTAHGVYGTGPSGPHPG